MIDLDGVGVERIEVENILSDLRRDEGLRLKSYIDSVGKSTIGYGHNLDDLGISERVAELLLEEDFINTVTELNRRLPWWTDLPKSQRQGLANMAFNLGLPKLVKFKKMLGALKRGNKARAAAEALDSKWARQVGERAWRIASLYRGD